MTRVCPASGYWLESHSLSQAMLKGDCVSWAEDPEFVSWVLQNLEYLYDRQEEASGQFDELGIHVCELPS